MTILVEDYTKKDANEENRKHNDRLRTSIYLIPQKQNPQKDKWERPV
jgi:hypothetical protein